MLARQFLLVVVASVSLAGCGESEDEAYRAAFKPVSAEIVTTGRGVEAAMTGAGTKKNDAEVAVAFARLADAAARLAGSLVRIDPPDNVKKDHKSLIRGLRREAGALEAISLAAIEGDAVAAKAATGRAKLVSGQIRSPRKRISKRIGLEHG